MAKNGKNGWKKKALALLLAMVFVAGSVFAVSADTGDELGGLGGTDGTPVSSAAEEGQGGENAVSGSDSEGDGTVVSGSGSQSIVVGDEGDSSVVIGDDASSAATYGDTSDAGTAPKAKALGGAGPQGPVIQSSLYSTEQLLEMLYPGLYLDKGAKSQVMIGAVYGGAVNGSYTLPAGEELENVVFTIKSDSTIVLQASSVDTGASYQVLDGGHTLVVTVPAITGTAGSGAQNYLLFEYYFDEDGTVNGAEGKVWVESVAADGETYTAAQWAGVAYGNVMEDTLYALASGISNLNVTKYLADAGDASARSFTFQLQDESGVPVEIPAVSGGVKLSGTGNFQISSVTPGVPKSATLLGLPMGNYKVIETNVDASEYKVTVDPAVIVLDDGCNGRVSVSNTRLGPCSLDVSKEYINPMAGAVQTSFTFQLQDMAGNPVPLSADQVSGTNARLLSAALGKFYINNFSPNTTQTATITGLFPGSYKIVEMDDYEYRTTISPASVTLSEGHLTDTIAVTNKMAYSLTISKELIETSYQGGLGPFGFQVHKKIESGPSAGYYELYDLKGLDYSEGGTYKGKMGNSAFANLRVGASVTIYGLEAGEYKVFEMLDQNQDGEYDVAYSKASVVLNDTTPIDSVTITNRRIENYTLNVTKVYSVQPQDLSWSDGRGNTYGSEWFASYFQETQDFYFQLKDSTGRVVPLNPLVLQISGATAVDAVNGKFKIEAVAKNGQKTATISGLPSGTYKVEEYNLPSDYNALGTTTTYQVSDGWNLDLTHYHEVETGIYVGYASPTYAPAGGVQLKNANPTGTLTVTNKPLVGDRVTDKTPQFIDYFCYLDITKVLVDENDNTPRDFVFQLLDGVNPVTGTTLDTSPNYQEDLGLDTTTGKITIKNVVPGEPKTVTVGVRMKICTGCGFAQKSFKLVELNAEGEYTVANSAPYGFGFMVYLTGYNSQTGLYESSIADSNSFTEAAITMTNTRKDGTPTCALKVNEVLIDPVETTTRDFVYQLQDVVGTPVALPGVLSGASPVPGVVGGFTIKGVVPGTTKTATIYGLAPGTYRVVETDSMEVLYTITVSPDSGTPKQSGNVTMAAGETGEVTFTHTRDTSKRQLTVTKTLADGSGDMTPQDFTFQLRNGSGTAVAVPSIMNGEKVAGTGNFKITGVVPGTPASAVIGGLGNGVYKIVETGPTDYIGTVTPAAGVTLSDTNMADTIRVMNVRKVYTLEVVKDLTDSFDPTLARDLTFQLQNGSGVAVEIPAIIGGTKLDGTGNFKMSAVLPGVQQMVTIKNLAAGTYKIVETNVGGRYTVTVAPAAGVTFGSAAPKTDGTPDGTITVTNEKLRTYSLNVTKKLVDSLDSTPQTFTFEVQNLAGDPVEIYKISGGVKLAEKGRFQILNVKPGVPKAATISELPSGMYQVVEIDATPALEEYDTTVLPSCVLLCPLNDVGAVSVKNVRKPGYNLVLEKTLEDAAASGDVAFQFLIEKENAGSWAPVDLKAISAGYTNLTASDTDAAQGIVTLNAQDGKTLRGTIHYLKEGTYRVTEVGTNVVNYVVTGENGKEVTLNDTNKTDTVSITNTRLTLNVAKKLVNSKVAGTVPFSFVLEKEGASDSWAAVALNGTGITTSGITVTNAAAGQFTLNGKNSQTVSGSISGLAAGTYRVREVNVDTTVYTVTYNMESYALDAASSAQSTFTVTNTAKETTSSSSSSTGGGSSSSTPGGGSSSTPVGGSSTPGGGTSSTPTGTSSSRPTSSSRATSSSRPVSSSTPGSSVPTGGSTPAGGGTSTPPGGGTSEPVNPGSGPISEPGAIISTGGTPGGGTGIGGETFDVMGVPLYGRGGIAWSLLNLMCATLGLFIALILFFGMFAKRKDKDNKAEDSEGDEYETRKAKQKKSIFALKVITILFGLLTGILFTVLENIRLPVVWVTQWSPIIVPVFVVCVAFLIVYNATKRKVKDEEKEEEQITEAPV